MGEPSRIQLQRDRKLVRRILAGDESALRRFMDDYFPRLYRYARQRMRIEADVDEVVQATLAQAARRLETFRGEATLLTWLVQICRHEISQQLKRAERESSVVGTFLNDDLLRAAVESLDCGDEVSPERESMRRELAALVQATLDQLPEHYASALELKYIRGLGSREIAGQLRISDEATQSLLARARRAFREICSEAMVANTRLDT